MYKCLTIIETCHKKLQQFLRDFEEEQAYDLHKQISKELMNGGLAYAKIFYPGLMMDCKPYVLCPNRFPYFVKNVKHLLLWIDPKYTNLIDITRAKKIVESHLETNFVIFENPPNMQSLHGIKHFHVFVCQSYKPCDRANRNRVAFHA